MHLHPKRTHATVRVQYSLDGTQSWHKATIYHFDNAGDLLAVIETTRPTRKAAQAWINETLASIKVGGYTNG